MPSRSDTLLTRQEFCLLKSCENNAFCYFTGYSDFCLDRFVDHKKAGMEKIVRNLVAVSKAKGKRSTVGECLLEYLTPRSGSEIECEISAK